MTENTPMGSRDLAEILNRDMKVVVPEDQLSAAVIFSMENELLARLDREQLKKAVMLRLRQQRVSYGLDVDVLNGELVADTDRKSVV